MDNVEINFKRLNINMTKAIRFSILSLLFVTSLAYAQKQMPKFTLAIEAKNPSIEAGKPVIVFVTRKNITNQIINDTRTTNPVEYLTFHVSRDGIPVDETEAHKKMHRSASGHNTVIASSPYFASLKPGESSRDIVELSFYYDMSKPGTYSVMVSQETVPGVPTRSVTVKSDAITIAVLPADSPSPEQR